ncbi:hypothetical protein EVAR_33310_1 [Eumeta japonica]|uniref:Uncharacterized protein n=1 Tax=Eumeta variegata TaxID=151549 RepID=A0A4C1WE58_EUMVA|nr:hypothetical protein EVAR_33310_1 [Eumeta japonica]
MALSSLFSPSLRDSPTAVPVGGWLSESTTTFPPKHAGKKHIRRRRSSDAIPLASTVKHCLLGHHDRVIQSRSGIDAQRLLGTACRALRARRYRQQSNVCKCLLIVVHASTHVCSPQLEDRRRCVAPSQALVIDDRNATGSDFAIVGENADTRASDSGALQRVPPPRRLADKWAH